MIFKLIYLFISAQRGRRQTAGCGKAETGARAREVLPGVIKTKPLAFLGLI